MIVYGIKNCNTVKSALVWLNENNVEFSFHDYKKSGITEEKLTAWEKQVGWENLVNKRGTTWRQLPDEVKVQVVDAASAIALMVDKTSVIKRPLIENGGKIQALGFDEDVYRKSVG